MREVLKAHSFYISIQSLQKEYKAKVCPHVEIAHVECNETAKRWKTRRPLIKRRMSEIWGNNSEVGANSFILFLLFNFIKNH